MDFIELAGGVRLELLRQNDEFLGFGEIRVSGVLLRSRQVPLRVHLDTPMGVKYFAFEIESIEGDENERRVHLAACGRQTLRGDFCDDYEDDLIFPTTKSQQIIHDRLTWILKPCQLELDGENFSGFSYALEWNSDERKIYRATIEATWELSGTIEGVTHLHQGQCNPPSYRGARDTFFSTSVVKTLKNPVEGEAALQNHSMQMLSRHGTMQCFDYQYAPSGVLLGVWERGEHVRSLIQKNSGEDVLFVIDEHHLEYSRQTKSCAKQILFAPIKDELRARDLWHAAKSHVQRGFEAQWNFEIAPLQTEDQINQSWMGNQPGARCWYGNRIVPRDQILRVLGDEWLPKIKEKGVELVGFNSFVETDVTQLGAINKLDFEGIHGDYLVGSICCVQRYRPAAHWGGMEGWKYFADRAHDLDLEVGTWVGHHISGHAQVLKEHPEWFNIGRTGKPNMGGYTSKIGATINWNSGFRRWLIDDLKRWRDEGGLDYLFFDSWGNLGCLPIHFNDNFSNNLDGLGKLISELQAAGFRYITNEGMGPFCPPRFGLGTHQTVAEGQNTISWWIGNEDMTSGTSPLIHAFSDLSEEEAHAQHFRFLANNALFLLEAWQDAPPLEIRDEVSRGVHHSGEIGTPLPGYYPDLLRLWPLVRNAMHRAKRTTLKGARGVLWSGGARGVLWSYKSFAFEASGEIEQVYPTRRKFSGAFETEPLGVYLMDDAKF